MTSPPTRRRWGRQGIAALLAVVLVVPLTASAGTSTTTGTSGDASSGAAAPLDPLDLAGAPSTALPTSGGSDGRSLTATVDGRPVAVDGGGIDLTIPGARTDGAPTAGGVGVVSTPVVAPAAGAPVSEPGDLFPQDPLVPPCDVPPCEPTELRTFVQGGYLPLDPITVLDTDGGVPLGPGEVRQVDVLGALGDTDGTDVGAVVLTLHAGPPSAPTSLTVWSPDLARPDTPSLSALPRRVRSTTVVTPLGAAGTVAVHNAVGSTDAQVQVIGWLPTHVPGVDESFVPVAPPEALLGSTLGPGTTTIPVAGDGDVPVAGAAAVLLQVRAIDASADTTLTVWPAGSPQPDTADLSVGAWGVSSNLVLAELGVGGAVAMANAAGSVRVDVAVVGWVPEASAYSPIAPQRLLHPSTAPSGGDVVDVDVTTAEGVPDVVSDGAANGRAASGDDAAAAVALQVTVLDAERPGEVTVWPSGWPRPVAPTLHVERRQAGTTLVVAEVGDDGKVSVDLGRTRGRVAIDVVGWFDQPAVEVDLAVPASTKLDLDAFVTGVVATTSCDPAPCPDPLPDPLPDDLVVWEEHDITLAAGAPDLAVGDRLVVTEHQPELPDGLIGEVTSRSGTGATGQVLHLVPATLQDAFPEGDLGVDLSQADYTVNGVDVPAATTTAVGDPGPPGVTVAKDDDVQVEFSVAGEDPNAECDLTGVTLDYGPLTDFEFRVRFRWFKAPTVTALATLGAYAEIALKNVALHCGWDVDLMKLKITVYGVQIVFTLSAEVELWAGLTGVDFHAYADAWVTLGVRDNRLVLESGSTADATYPTDTISPKDLSAYAMVDVWLHLSVKLYDKIGPVLSVGPFAETVIQPGAGHPWWWLDIGLGAKVRLDLDLWFDSWSWQLFDGEIPLAELIGMDTCSPLGPGLPGVTPGWEPCRTPAPDARPNGDTRGFEDRIRVVSSNAELVLLTGRAEVPRHVRAGDPVGAARMVASGWEAADATWQVVGGALPSGVTLDPSTGALDGTFVGAPSGVVQSTATVEARYGPEPTPAVGEDHNPADGGYDDPLVGPDADGVAGRPYCDAPLPVGRRTCERWYGPGDTTSSVADLGDQSDRERVEVAVTVYPEALITTDGLPGAVVGFRYGDVDGVEAPTDGVQLTDVGWAGEHTWSVIDEDPTANRVLPPGLVLDPSGFLHGVPTQPGTYHPVVQVEDTGPGDSIDAREYTITIEPLRTEAVGWLTRSTDLSADGRWAVHSTSAEGASINDDNDGLPDIVVADLPDVIAPERISLDDDNQRWVYEKPTISADGRYVAYVAVDQAPPPGDPGLDRILLTDRDTDLTVDATAAPCLPADSCAAAGWPFEKWVGAGRVEIAHDGRHVAYELDGEVYLYDAVEGVNRMVSITPLVWDGSEATTPLAWAGEPSVSGDGSTVVFTEGLAPDQSRIAVVDLDPDGTTGTVEHLLPATTHDADDATISADGRTVVFLHHIDDYPDVVLHDRDLPSPQDDVALTEGEGFGGYPVRAIDVSSDGRFVSYATWDSRIWLHDTASPDGPARRLQVVVPGGGVWPGGSDAATYSPAVTDDGSIVGFVSAIGTLVPDDLTPFGFDAYIYQPDASWLDPPAP